MLSPQKRKSEDEGCRQFLEASWGRSVPHFVSDFVHINDHKTLGNIRDSVVPAPPLWELIHVVKPQVVNVAKADLEYSRKQSHVGNKSDVNPQIGQFGRDTSQSSEFLSPNASRSNGNLFVFQNNDEEIKIIQ